jgi:excisionase family DNA binding protein
MDKHSQQPHLSAAVDALIDLLSDRIADRVIARLEPRPEQDTWLDLSNAADYLGLHSDTLRKRARAGLIPFEQEAPGCRLFFHRTDLDAWRHAGGAPARIANVADLASRRQASRG